MEETIPNLASIELQLGRIQLEAGDPRAAERHFRFLVNEPGCPSNVRVEAYIGLGKALDRGGKRRAAQACYRRVLALTDDWTYRRPARALYRRPGRTRVS